MDILIIVKHRHAEADIRAMEAGKPAKGAGEQGGKKMPGGREEKCVGSYSGGISGHRCGALTYFNVQFRSVRLFF